MNKKRGYEKITLKMTSLQLMIVHGAVCLGLTHRIMAGPLRKLATDFVRTAEEQLVACGLFSQSAVDSLHVKSRVMAAKNIFLGIDSPVCKICGCTDDHACEGGCFWIAPNLCSACAVNLSRSEEQHEDRN